MRVSVAQESTVPHAVRVFAWIVLAVCVDLITAAVVWTLAAKHNPHKPIAHDQPISAPEFRVVDKRPSLRGDRCIVRLSTEQGDIDLETEPNHWCGAVGDCVALYKGLAEGPMLQCKGKP